MSEMPVPPAAPDAGVDVEVTADVASDTDAAAEVEAAEVQAAEVEAAEANADVDGGVNAEVDTESGSTADELDGLSSRPLAEHAEVYEHIYGQLQEALAGIDDA